MTLSKNQLKRLSSYRLQKNCDTDGVFVVEGIRMCEEALASGFDIHTICATEDWMSSHGDCLPAGCECFTVDNSLLERLSGQKSPNKVWMLLRRGGPVPLPEAMPLTIALDNLQDPGNMGTLIRSADWFGIRHIVCSPGTVSCYNPKVVQSSMGSIFRIRIDYCNLTSYLADATAHGTTVYGATLDGANIYHTPLTMPAVIVIGNEGNGISAPTLEKINQKVTIPNCGGTCESLNAASAATVLCSEFARKALGTKDIR